MSNELEAGQGSNVEPQVSAGGVGEQNTDAASSSQGLEHSQGSEQTSAQEPQAQATEQIVDDNNIPIMKMADKDGKEQQFIPYDRFKQILDERNSLNSFLENLESNPEAKKKFAESLGLSQSNAAEPPEQQPAPLQKFVAENVDPQHHGHYQGFAEAIAAEAKSYIDSVKEEMLKELQPLKSLYAKQELKSIESRIPDFGKYRPQITELMRTKGVDPEEAYVLASWKEKQKAAQKAGQMQEKQRQQAINRAPITKQNGTSIPVQKTPPKTLKEAILANWDKMEQENA